MIELYSLCVIVVTQNSVLMLVNVFSPYFQVANFTDTICCKLKYNEITECKSLIVNVNNFL